MTTNLAQDLGDRRRAHVESILADYPNIDVEEIAILKRWFRNEASALEVGLIASEPALSQPYRLFRRDHLDRFEAADFLKAAVFIAITAACIVLIAWRAL